MDKFNDPIENWISSRKREWRGLGGLSPGYRVLAGLVVIVVVGSLVSQDFREVLLGLR